MAAVAVLVLMQGVGVDAKSKLSDVNWDDLGAEFCRQTLAGNLAGMRPILTESLANAIEAAAANPEMPPPRVLFQTYTNEVPNCTAATRNAALVEIRRSNAGGGAPSWTEYLVIVPERDGTSRVDDVLFATQRSDTLRARLDYYSATR
jgi:hypothetical protein